MSTRGTIARLTDTRPLRFKGRYHHWDSYPTRLGQTLWQLYHGHFARNLEAMLEVLIGQHPAGWSSINGTDFSRPPGFTDCWDRDPEQSHGPVCYCHGERHEAAWEVTEQNAAASGCEYAYVFYVFPGYRNPGHTLDHEPDGEQKAQMWVLSSYTRQGSKMIGMFGQGDANAHWQIIAVVDLDGPEPDWEIIEERAHEPHLDPGARS